MISIAIPDSLFLEDDSLREKTVKVGLLARPVAIFGVERIYIYRDNSRNHDQDYEIAKLIFEYLETPQYLRRRLIKKRKELEYAGLLPPLRIPSHAKDSTPNLNEYREGTVVNQNGQLMAEIGSKELAFIEEGSRVHEGQRITVRVTSIDPLKIAISARPKDSYWGYEIRRAPTLGRFIRSANFDLTILTSRMGRPVNGFWQEFCKKITSADKILVCFGSPEAGVDKMLNQDGTKVDELDSMYLNAFPGQNTQTVRLEEALMGFLSILNLAIHL